MFRSGLFRTPDHVFHILWFHISAHILGSHILVSRISAAHILEVLLCGRCFLLCMWCVGDSRI